MPKVSIAPDTAIRAGTELTTAINFFHVDEEDQATVLDVIVAAAERMSEAPGNVSLNVLRSLEGTRIVTYGQWSSESAALSAEKLPEVPDLIAQARRGVLNEPRPRFYTVVYADDRTPEGASVISHSYTGAIFINEITTQPATQGRLLELVIANNEIQSQNTTGYRSANFHRSSDGERAVNYSLWDSAEHCIQAISAMADMDENLEETVEIASPDFRFYELVYAHHA
ncbi:antibiotic biosynthesis monooxygenase family protein [Microbacterium sp. HJ5]